MLSARTAVAPPSITTNTISGTAIAQQVLTSNVTASGTISRVWKRNGSAISGATSGTYTLVEADIGTKITVTATATNGAGSANTTTVDFGPIAALAPTITGASLSGTPTYAQTLTATPSGITGLPTPTTSYVWNRDGSPISGAQSSTYTLTSSDIGTAISATITVTNSGGSASRTTTSSAQVSKISPTFGSWNDIPKTYGNSPFTVTAPTVTGSLGGSFTYSSATTSVISVVGTTLTVAGAGSSVITATFTPNDLINYNTATTFMTVTVGAGPQTITRTSTSPTSPVKSGTYSPTATASSSLTVAITIASGSSSVCSISAGVVTFNTVGSCVIEYNQSGNSNYTAATQVTETLTIGKATPTFSTWSDVSKNYGDSAFTVTAPTVTGSLGGSFTYSSATTSVITVSGTTLTVAGAGSSVITATFTPTD
jgi:hypothetical protein